MSISLEPQRAPRWHPVLLGLFALGFSCVMTQLVLMREMLGAFSGNEMVLGVVLGLWLLLMGLGAWLARPLARLPAPLAALAVLLMLVAVLPPMQVFLLRALRNVVFIRGAAVGVGATVGSAFILLLPYCLAAGCALALGCSTLAREDAARGIGRGYVADSVGSIIGGLLFSFVLVRAFDHIAILLCPALLALLAAGTLGACSSAWPRSLASRSATPQAGHQAGARLPWMFHFRTWGLALLAALLGLALLALAVSVDLDACSTRLQFPQQHILARANSPYGKLLLTRADGQLNLLENGVPLLSSRDVAHLEETVHYALAQRPEARNVLLVGGGISGTAKEILKYPVDRVDYVELDPMILDFGQAYFADNLADPRIRIINTDGRLFIQQTAARQAGPAYDVIILDLPDPATAQLNRFYTVEFLAEAKRALTGNGVLSFSLGQYENYVSPDLARLLASAHRSLAPSFRNIQLIPGSRVFFLASDGPLSLEIAARLEQRHIRTSFVSHHYLDAMLTPDRLADLARAVAQPAALNQDFNPVLYFYFLRHWMSQFDLRFGPLQVLLLLLLAFYLLRLRRARYVLFASGFAASALELVLLLAFQALCGSVYHQVGIIVTLFMLGLALGAWLSSSNPNARVPAFTATGQRETEVGARTPCSLPASQEHLPPLRTSPFGLRTFPPPFGLGPKRRLSLLSAAIAAYAVLLAVLLPSLRSLTGASPRFWLLKVIIALLTLILALLVGLQFPIANELEPQDAASSVSRLYTADFVGAALGALLACTLLLPLVGVTGVCWLTAALNALAAAVVVKPKNGTP